MPTGARARASAGRLPLMMVKELPCSIGLQYSGEIAVSEILDFWA